MVDCPLRPEERWAHPRILPEEAPYHSCPAHWLSYRRYRIPWNAKAHLGRHRHLHEPTCVNLTGSIGYAVTEAKDWSTMHGDLFSDVGTPLDALKRSIRLALRQIFGATQTRAGGRRPPCPTPKLLPSPFSTKSSTFPLTTFPHHELQL